jgi:hypothetical protein
MEAALALGKLCCCGMSLLPGSGQLREQLGCEKLMVVGPGAALCTISSLSMGNETCKTLSG